MLNKKIEADLNQALKAKETAKVAVLRNLKAVIQNEEINKQKELVDQEIMMIVRQQIKKSQEAQTLFTKGGREDLVKQNVTEQAILKVYLPPELSEEKLMGKVQAVVAQHQDITNQGQLTGLVIKELRTEAEPSRIAAVVKKIFEA